MADFNELSGSELFAAARQRRDAAFGSVVTFSPKVFIPLTMLCQDKCGYCTFAQPPARLDAPYLTPEQVLEIASVGAESGCHEALFTLGEILRLAIRSHAIGSTGMATSPRFTMSLRWRSWCSPRPVYSPMQTLGR